MQKRCQILKTLTNSVSEWWVYICEIETFIPFQNSCASTGKYDLRQEKQSGGNTNDNTYRLDTFYIFNYISLPSIKPHQLRSHELKLPIMVLNCIKR